MSTRKLTAAEIRYILQSGMLPASGVRKILKAKVYDQVDIEAEYKPAPGESRKVKLVATVLPRVAPPKPPKPSISIQRDVGAGCLPVGLFLMVSLIWGWVWLST